MSTREQMQSLTQNILRSYEDRVNGLERLREAARANLKGFQGSQAAMSKELRAELAKGAAGRKGDVTTMLKGFDNAHAAGSKKMRAELAKGATDRNHDVTTMLKGFDNARVVGSKKMRAELAKGATDRKRDVTTMLKDFDSALVAGSKKLRAGLTKGATDRKRDLTSILKSFDGELKKIRASEAGARDEWQKLTATMQSKRGMPIIAVKRPKAVAQVRMERVAPPSPDEDMVEERAVARAEAMGVTAGINGLRDRVFEYLTNHPDGTKMTELEHEFGMARIQMAKLLRSLIDENRVGKRDLFYFAN